MSPHYTRSILNSGAIQIDLDDVKIEHKTEYQNFCADFDVSYTWFEGSVSFWIVSKGRESYDANTQAGFGIN